MKNIDSARFFEIEIGTMSDIERKPTTYEIEYWMNQAYQKFIKTRYTGINYRKSAFEQDQKRIDELKKLIKVTEFNLLNTNVGNEYKVLYPEDLFITLGEDAYIYGVGQTEDEAIVVDVWECTIENYTTKMNNSLTDFHYHNHYARPARLFLSDGIKLVTDGNYNIKKYVLYYLKTPSKIDIFSNPTAEFTELNEVAHMEIVKLAAQMYIENQANPRYKTISQEVATME